MARYDENLVAPMRKELTDIGVRELRTADDVDGAFSEKTGTTLLVINSICGCSANTCRPGVATALKNSKKPLHTYTVFAGQDTEATEKARSYFTEYPPSSPAIVLLKDGKAVHMVDRNQIQGHTAEDVASNLSNAFNKYC